MRRCFDTEYSGLARRGAFLQNNHASGVAVKAAGLYSPLESRSSTPKLHIELYAATDWKDLNSCKEGRKKAAPSSEKQKASANELLLIGRSSIRETLHYLLTPLLRLKGPDHRN